MPTGFYERKIKRGGWKLSKETRAKMSARMKGKKLTLGYKHTPESRMKNSIAHMGLNTWTKGSKASDETKRKLSEMRKGDKNPGWKGGYENTLILLRKRRAYKMNAEGSHTLEEWQNLKKKYNDMCLCCKKQEPDIKLAADHIVPLIKGGSNYISNIQPLCKSCNSRKYDKFIDYRITV